jgi:hypothetical protein
MSATGLRTFRREHEDFFADANRQLVRKAVEAELIDPSDLATDSVRVRAEASTKSIRTVARSEARLGELQAVDVAKLDKAERGD